MIFTSLTLTNFGVFRGRHTVDLTTSRSRPVVLFGGLNGAGKTTVLEAIRLSLYGPGALGPRPSRDAYAGYLASRIHASPSLLLQPTFASITVGFQYSDVGRIHEYTVTREWERATGDGVTEHFTVTRDGAPLEDLGAEHWQDFIEELIPPGVSQLFFFDGEKIQQLAEDSSDQQTLADSMKALLGLDLINRLQADLGLYRSRLAKPTRNGPEAAELEALEQQVNEARLDLERRAQGRDMSRHRVTDLQVAIARVETKLQAEGGAFARNREGLVRKQAALRAELAQYEEAIRQRCPGALPFALVPKLCHQLEARLLAEEQAQQRLAARDFLDTARGTLEDRLKSAEFWATLPQLPTDVRVRVCERVLAAVTEALTGERADEIPLVHQLTPAVRRQLLAWLGQATAELPETMKVIAGNIERVSRELHRVEGALRKVPADDVVRPLLQELRALYAELASLSRDAMRTEEELTSAQAALAALERRRDQRGVGGEQVHELAERAGVEDERVAPLAGVVAFGPAEHVAVEVEDLGPAAVVERGVVEADGDVVEAGRERALGHGDTSGRTRTLPTSSPAASRCMASSTPSRPTSSGSTSRSTGRAPDASRSRAGANPSSS